MRVVTWNTWWCFGPWTERRPLLPAALARTGADVVLLQETWPGQSAELAVACGLDVISVEHGEFHPEGIDGSPADHRFGNAVLGRTDEVTHLATLPLTSAADDIAPRMAIAVRHRGERGPLVLVSTHLCHLHDGGAVRATQLDHIKAWADDLAEGDPILLGGDLNQIPTSDEYAASLAPHWTDLWAAARPGEPGSTMVVDNPRLASVDWMAVRSPDGAPPGVRLDYLLGRSGPMGVRWSRSPWSGSGPCSTAGPATISASPPRSG